MLRKLFFLFIPFAVTVSYGQITNGLIVHYTCDGDAVDNTSNNLDGTTVNTSPTIDRFGATNSALFFNGTNAFIELQNNSLLKDPLPLTIAFWVKITEQAYQIIVQSDLDMNQYYGYYLVIQQDLTIHAGLGAGGPLNSSGRRGKVSADALTLGNWHHITAVINNGSDIDIYIDCQDAGGSYTGTGPDQIGYSNGATYLFFNETDNGNAYSNGSFDDFAIWDRALTLSEIQSLCSGPLSIDELEQIGSVNVFPNPSTGYFSINSTVNEPIIEVAIIDAQGKIVQQDKHHEGINCEDWTSKEQSNGLYMVRFAFESGRIENKQIVINH
ncbi:MAG: T9SS type A sorting domain-containing protein [Fluviicola sp.]|nr:T9SS type A sorting domain-containing protein [Fluviicola sp.]